MMKVSISQFYPSALKGCVSIFFTHGGWVGGGFGRQWEKISFLGCILEVVSYRNFTLDGDIGWGIGSQHVGVTLI